jgi:SHS2 domain-containing protein
VFAADLERRLVTTAGEGTPRFELFDHTADIGIRAVAPTLAGLVAPAARGLYAVIGDLVPRSEQGPHRQPACTSWELTGDEPAILLRDYLAELLTLFDRDHRMAVAHDVKEFRVGRLALEATVCPVDEERSAYIREVKAITYHALAIQRTPEGYEATIIVDI